MHACVVVVVSILVDFLSAHTYVLTGHQPIPRKRHIVRHAAHYLLGSWTVTSHFPAKVCIPGSFFFLFFMPFVLKDIPSLFVWMVEALKSVESSREVGVGFCTSLRAIIHPRSDDDDQRPTDRPWWWWWIINARGEILAFCYSFIHVSYLAMES